MFIEMSCKSYMKFVQIADLMGCLGNINGLFLKDIQKVLFSETINGMKANLPSHTCLGYLLAITFFLLSLLF